MAETAEAVARLRLDASGFDKQANASFREFSKQLTSVKDATDVAMRGAEALQKVFVKTLGGTIAIGAANALADAMRDVGAKIGSAGQLAADAQAGMKGLAQSFQDGAARAEKLNAAAAGVLKTLEELRNAGPVQGAIFRLFDGDRTLNDLQESLRGAADAEMMAGAINSARRTQKTSGMDADQRKRFDLEAARQAELSAADRIGDPYMRERTKRALQDRYATEDVEDQDRAFRAADLADLRSNRADADRQTAVELEQIRRDRASARSGAETKASLERAAEEARALQAARRAEDQNRNTMQIVEAQSELASAEERKKAIDAEVIRTNALAASIASGMFGSSRGPGQRKTSTEIGDEKAVERARQQRRRENSEKYMDQVAGDIVREKYQKEFGQDITPGYDSMGNLLTPEQTAEEWAKNMEKHGKGVSNYEKNKKNRESKIRQAQAEEDAPFEAAQKARTEQADIIKYMQQVREVLNELKAYAHVT